MGENDRVQSRSNHRLELSFLWGRPSLTQEEEFSPFGNYYTHFGMGVGYSRELWRNNSHFAGRLGAGFNFSLTHGDYRNQGSGRIEGDLYLAVTQNISRFLSVRPFVFVGFASSEHSYGRTRADRMPVPSRDLNIGVAADIGVHTSTGNPFSAEFFLRFQQIINVAGADDGQRYLETMLAVGMRATFEIFPVPPPIPPTQEAVDRMRDELQIAEQNLERMRNLDEIAHQLSRRVQEEEGNNDQLRFEYSQSVCELEHAATIWRNHRPPRPLYYFPFEARSSLFPTTRRMPFFGEQILQNRNSYLDLIAAQIHQHPDYVYILDGYAINSRDPSENTRLSRERVERARRYLVETAHVPSASLHVDSQSFHGRSNTPYADADDPRNNVVTLTPTTIHGRGMCSCESGVYSCED